MAASRARATKPAFSPAEIRSILLEHRYLAKVPDVVAKWGISIAELRRWKREHGFAYLSGTLRELVIVALRSSSVSDPAELVSFLDMQNHTIYTPAEIETVLDALVVEGKARKQRGVWSYDETKLARRRGFIF